MEFVGRDRVLDLDHVAIMGVLNVTPDSFSDGGMWLDPEAAIKHAIQMVQDGASIIDVGGESTRPDAEPVELREELRRVVPVIERLSAEVDVPISIDTRKPQVADAALEAGATIVNDTLGEEVDPDLARVAADFRAGFITMHSRGTPQTMRSLSNYTDVVAHVRTWLQGRAAELEQVGIDHRSIALDPGFGFAKTPDQNLRLLNRLPEIVELGFPVLVGTSRKSFIGAVLGGAENERLEGTAATVTAAVLHGARIVRVHDAFEMSRVVRMAEAIRNEAVGQS
ncbi:MAG TPA: dihydropteroate synthase [Actinomycetota bacterium]|nr:dihydropteroate synthase [Actinomycetota bacterium]